MVKQTQKHREFEYRLIIAFKTNERLQKQTTVITIETTKAFANFRYELSVEEKSEGKMLHYKILGLKAPQLDLPSAGTATFTREYETLKGKNQIIVERTDGTTNAFDINLTRAGINLLRSPKHPFIEFVVR